MPNKDFPIVFESVDGECQKPENSTSFYNAKEVNAVMQWVAKLVKTTLAQDIGIISPYSRQCEKIRDNLIRSGYSGISVGTAEIFQGQERKVIIISTVRTGESDFVNDKQVPYNLANISLYFTIKDIIDRIVSIFFCLL